MTRSGYGLATPQVANDNMGAAVPGYSMPWPASQQQPSGSHSDFTLKICIVPCATHSPTAACAIKRAIVKKRSQLYAPSSLQRETV
jgi:hypothetical protein